MAWYDGVTTWPGLLEAWLALTSVKYHGNLYILIPLNQRLALTRLRATGPWWPLKLDRLAKDRSHCFLACVAQISIRKTDDKQRRRRKREGLKKQCCSLHLVHFFAVTERLRSENAVFQSFIVDVNNWQRIFFLFLNLDWVLGNSSPDDFAYIWQSERKPGIIAIKVQRMQT